MPAQARAPDDLPPTVRARAPIGFATCLVLLLVFFLALLGYGRAWLAQPLRPDMSVYLLLMIGLTVGIWVLTWLYVLLTGRDAEGAGRP